MIRMIDPVTRIYMFMFQEAYVWPLSFGFQYDQTGNEVQSDS